MKKLLLGEVPPGSIVARPVVAGNGVVLVQPGTALTAEVLARLDGLHVEAVWLVGASPDARPLDEMLAELDARFAGHERNDLMQQLKAVVAGRLRQEAGEDSAG